MLAIVMSGKHLKGVSKKSGNEYDFYSYPFVGRSKRLGHDDEFTADSLNVPNELKDFDFPCLVNVLFDNIGRVESMEVISSDTADFSTFFDD